MFDPQDYTWGFVKEKLSKSIELKLSENHDPVQQTYKLETHTIQIHICFRSIWVSTLC